MSNKKPMRLLLMILLAYAEAAQPQAPKRSGMERSEIVFVCEHGAALSVVASAYFNKIAHERHLPLHARARGTAPQADIAVSARAGLEADGVAFATDRPEALSRRDAKHALRVVTFTPLPSQYSKLAMIEKWDDVPPTSADYGRARDMIVERIENLLTGLQLEIGRKTNPD
jgi:arsenate reductase (thioredoxin)